MTPQRIQRKRAKGWTNPGAIYIGRGSIFGNPFKVGEPHPVTDQLMTHADVVELYGMWIETGHDDEVEPDVCVLRLYIGDEMTKRGQAVADAAHNLLRGKTLMCWCGADQPCHGDALLELVNGVPA